MGIQPPVIPLAGLVLDMASDIAGTAVLFTGLVAAGLRTIAVRADLQPERVEWMTAMGFLVGMCFAGVLVVFDVAMG